MSLSDTPINCVATTEAKLLEQYEQCEAKCGFMCEQIIVDCRHLAVCECEIELFVCLFVCLIRCARATGCVHGAIKHSLMRASPVCVCAF